MEGNFREAKSRTLGLPEDDPVVFERFQLWLYTNSVLEKAETVKDISYMQLVNLYIFADIRGISDLQNAIIDHIIDKESLENTFPSQCIPRVYQCLSPNNPLRRLLVDTAAELGILDAWFTPDSNEEFVPEFMRELAVALYHMRDESKERISDFHLGRLEYHVTTD